MTTITVPKQLVREKDLVVISRKDYEEFLSLQKALRLVRPTASEEKIIERGHREVRSGQYRRY